MLGVQHLQTQLATQHSQRVQTMSTLQGKEQELSNLQAADARLEVVQKKALLSVQTHIQGQQRQRNILESQIKLTQQQIQSIEQQTSEANALMQNTTYVAQTTAAMPQLNTNSVVGYAEQFLGVPYVWGGTSSSGFDCSGFTQYVYSHFGVSINRTSEDQFAEGVSVAQSDLQPGDLVFFSTYAPGASHVGIYVGNGLMVDAQDAGVSIAPVFSSYWGPKYLGARRLVKS
jgi:peptidoglycan DL-endopeptidase CwlO